MSARFAYKVMSLVVLFSLAFQPLTVMGKQVDQETGRQGVSAPAPGTGLYRTTVTVDSPSRRARLAALGVTVLGEPDPSGFRKPEGSTAVILADADQLETLARLRFEPRASDDADALIAHHAAAQPALAAAWGEMAQRIQTDKRMAVAAASLSAYPLASVAALTSIDDDGDGLTNTEEAWWCTDPLNPNSDGDAQGYTDGQEVRALLDFRLPRTTRWSYRAPFGPPAAWPDFNGADGNPATPACNDGDYDTIPDYAEAYMVGTSVPDENTDGDKFDDGQELFGRTYCPGGDTTGGYGIYPRTQDVTFITCVMPSWIRPPGDSPFVAAYPVIDFLVDPATIEVTTKEIRTIERTITQGEEISTGFAETQGNSTTVGTVDTNTHSTWQENSKTEGGIEPTSAVASTTAPPTSFSLAPALPPLKINTKVTVPISPTQLSPEQIFVIPSVAIDDPAVEQAIRDAMARSQDALAYTKEFAISSIEPRGDWMIVGITGLRGAKKVDDWNALDHGVWFGWILLRRLADGTWMGATRGTEEFSRLLADVPESTLSQQAKLSFGAFHSSQAPEISWGYNFPWKPGTRMQYGRKGVHGDNYEGYSAWRSVDFLSWPEAGTNNAPNEVRAARGGIIELICSPQDANDTQAIIRIDDLMYTHLRYDRNLHWTGNGRMTGDYLGSLVTGTISPGIDHCGFATQTLTTYHLHLSFPNQATIQFEDWTLNTNDMIWRSGNRSVEKEGWLASSGVFQDPCDVPKVITPIPTSVPTPPISTNQRNTNFIEIIGRTLKSWWGNLSGGTALSQATGISASPPGCSGGSCTSQIGGGGNYNLNYSDSRSAGQCGGNSSPGGGSDGGVGGGGSGLAFNDTGSAMESLRVWSQTQTAGEGWSTSHSELRSETQYAEVTRSRTNTLVSSEAWSTATTTDPTDAAVLTFNYNLYNTGSDAAVHLTGIKINLLIGDLPVKTLNLPDSFDILPGGAKGPFGSGDIHLTLDQLAAIDNGAPIRVVLADYGYDDNLYDANAWGRSVLFHVDDGTADGDESVDTYLITTNLVQNETYQDTLARYFPVTIYQGAADGQHTGAITGTITSIRTPEFAPDGEITGWSDHPVNAHGWWELSISLGGETAGVKHFKDMPAKPKTDVYLRYVLDTDADGYTDRAERDAGTDPADPQSHPRPLLAVAQHTAVSGNTATVQVSLQNEGNFDASSVELWAIAPDDSITINDNLVGGGGRVRAGRQVVLGARIGKPDLANWQTSRAKPYPDGQFEGASAKTFTFRADATGNIGVTPGLAISWSSTGGAPWTLLAVGSGYTPWTALPLSDGLTIAFSGDYIAQGETFTFATALPIDTFSYTINRTPYSKPLIIASYNDPAGNHKFVSDVEVAHIQDDLAPYLGQMRYGFQMDVMGATAVTTGTNTAYVVFNNPSDMTITNGNVFVEFATLNGVVAKEYVLTDQTFRPGPNVTTLNWNTADFSPAFDPAKDYHILAFAADRQGTIFENTVKDLDQVGKDKLPTFAMADSDATWNFDTAPQGTLLKRSFTFANTGALDLLTYVSAPAGLTVSQTGSRRVGLADMTTYEMALNTVNLGVGPYSDTVKIRTSDPDARERTVRVTGTVTAAPADTPVGALQRPLDTAAPVSGTQGQQVDFTHTLGPEPQTLHPVKVYNQDYSKLWGVGKYATPFGQGTASYDMFGDGRDGVMPSSGDLNNDNGVGVGIVNGGSQDSYSVNVTNAYGIRRVNPGDVVLIHQTQGSNAGCWEINKAVSDFGDDTATYQLVKPLQCNYASGGNNHAQIQRVPQYTDCTVSGTVTPLSAWNGSWGGILAITCRNSMTIQSTGRIDLNGLGFRGTSHGARYLNQNGVQGEGSSGPGSQSYLANTNGGGGGQGGQDAGGGGGGGNGTSGIDGQDSFNHTPHYGGRGGGALGNEDLSSMLLGGAGGEGGADEDGGNPGGGGNGGGIGVIFAGTFSNAGTIEAYGRNGGDACQNCGGGGGAGMAGGGGGAGGSILIRGKEISLGSNRIQALGGIAGSGSPGMMVSESPQFDDFVSINLLPQDRAPGGAGGVGRVRIEHCESFSGLTVPPASAQKLNCYIADQATDPTYGLLQLPESGAHTYQVQYGRKLNWGDGGEQISTLRVPAGAFTAVLLDVLVSGVGSGSLTFKLDIGNDGNGVWDWEVTQDVNDAVTLTNSGTPNLAAAFNTYWASHGAPLSGSIDVPVKVYLSKAGQVLLTNLQVTQAGSELRHLRLPVQAYNNVQLDLVVDRRVVLSDDFSAVAPGRWTEVVGTWRVMDGVYDAVGAGGSIDAWAYAGSESWTDYSLKTRINMLGGNGEVVFRSTGHWINEYRLEIWSATSSAYPNRLDLSRYRNGVSTTLFNQVLPISIPQVVDVHVDVVGDRIQVYLDGTKWIDLRDPGGLATGRIGLGVIWDWHAQFDHVEVVSPSNAPGPLAVSADVGGNGSVDWTYTGSPTYPASLTTGNLAAAVNAYLAGKPDPTDVPLRFTLSPFATLNLTGFTATPVGGADASIGDGDVTFGGGIVAAAVHESATNTRIAPADHSRIRAVFVDGTNPVEGDTITIHATIHNDGTLDTGPLTASFYAIRTTQYADYIGSAFVPSVPPSSPSSVSIPWNTLGFTGTVPIRVVVDPYNRVAELSETNNVATATVTIRTRPDLSIPAIALSDAEPVAGRPVIVTVTARNAGETGTGDFAVSLAAGATEVGRKTIRLSAAASAAVTFTWTPAKPGPYRLFSRTDRTGVVGESDEGNNDAWLDVYAGFRGPIGVDAGAASDRVYAPDPGYGYLNTGTRTVSCGGGATPDATLRAAITSTLLYRFDHLLPAASTRPDGQSGQGHFYHLDLTLRDCDGSRAQEVWVDGMLMAPATDLSDHQPHRLSILLDPALYRDRTITVALVETHGLDAQLAEISLHDVDYRYADAGHSTDPNDLADPRYPGPAAARAKGKAYGWLDGERLASWGSLPGQTVRMDRADTVQSDDPDSELRYRFDGLDPARRYRLRLTFRQFSGAAVIQKVQLDRTDATRSFTLASGQAYSVTIAVPPAAYATDGSIVAGIVRMDCAASEAQVNEIALEEETLPAENPCHVQVTPYRTIATGGVTINGAPAAVGTVIEALSPREDVVGCTQINAAGAYPYMHIYGETPPTIPGMRDSEIIEFRVNGIPAVAQPSLYWKNDSAPHTINLGIGSTEGQCSWLASGWNLFSTRLDPPVPTVERALGPIAGRYCQMRWEKLAYDCTQDLIYRNLKELDPFKGYWLKLEGTAGANLRIEGVTVPVTTPILLHEYWNWVSYLPTAPLPITTALQSIAGRYLLVLSRDKTYNPTDLGNSNLWTLEPGQGYQIRATQAVTLVYPSDYVPGASESAWHVATASASACPTLAPTPFLTLLYGQARLGAGAAPAGAVVEIVTPRGDVAGCTVVRAGGGYGYVHVYGEDPTAPPIPGFREGEPLAFRVNGVSVAAAPALAWQNDRTQHAVNLAGDVWQVWLPMVVK